MYTLYTQATPNGLKASIALEELGLSYEPYSVALAQGEQYSDWYLRLNPEGTIPVLYDQNSGRAVWESNAILLYLAQAHSALFPEPAGEPDLYWQGMAQLFYQASAGGPGLGQLFFFTYRASQQSQFAIEHFREHSARLLRTLEAMLAQRSYLLGERFTICDIAQIPWIHAARLMAEPVGEHPNVAAWLERCEARPGVQAGLQVPKSMDSAMRRMAQQGGGS